MLYEFGYNNLVALKFIVKTLKERNLNVDIFYTGTDIVNTGRLTGNSSISAIYKQKSYIREHFSNAKLFIAVNDTVLQNFELKKTLESIKLLFETSDIDGVIIANPILLYYLNDYFFDNNVDVIISTITNIDSVEKIEKLLLDEVYFTGIVAPISVNRDFSKLKSIKSLIGDRKLTVIPNESCSPHCFNRQFHFNAHSIKNVEFSNKFVEKCTQEISKFPKKVLMSGMLSPSMVHNGYQDIIDVIKLPNRHFKERKDINKSIDRLGYYINGQDPEDFFSLLCFDYQFSISSQRLSKIFTKWMNCRNNCYSCSSCSDFDKFIHIKTKTTVKNVC